MTLRSVESEPDSEPHSAGLDARMKKTGDVRIGISGWRYQGWRGSFYPEDLKHANA
ncbi:hypothetical protein HDG33_006681 [Paraburkholderia sp. Cpub6]|nr:hypothetical protein [Paraburkholderia sp. Cpub6]